MHACIEAAVSSAEDAGTNSFVIYGEPQSGKTEMMICLTAKLLDDGYRIVIHLLNDSVQLLQQNLDRFQRSNLSPAARNFSDAVHRFKIFFNDKMKARVIYKFDGNISFLKNVKNAR